MRFRHEPAKVNYAPRRIAGGIARDMAIVELDCRFIDAISSGRFADPFFDEIRNGRGSGYRHGRVGQVFFPIEPESADDYQGGNQPRQQYPADPPGNAPVCRLARGGAQSSLCAI